MAINAQRDGNFQPTASGWDASNLVVEALRVDPATSRLEVDIQGTTTTTPGTIAAVADDNFVNVGYAVTDDASLTLVPLMVDVRSGLLWVDAIIE